MLVKLAVMGEVRKRFRPEFINRLDEIVVFHALDQKNIGAIAMIQLRQLEGRLAKMDMALEVSDKALEKIAEAGFDPVYGARPLKRAIQQQIENPLLKLIAIPHAVTTARPDPCRTVVPMNTMLRRSPRATASGNMPASLSAAVLSPVSEASSICKDAARKRRPSAATASPSASTRTSPHTSGHWPRA